MVDQRLFFITDSSEKLLSVSRVVIGMSCKVLRSSSNLGSFHGIYRVLLRPSCISFTVTAGAPLAVTQPHTSPSCISFTVTAGAPLAVTQPHTSPCCISFTVTAGAPLTVTQPHTSPCCINFTVTAGAPLAVTRPHTSPKYIICCVRSSCQLVCSE